MKTALIVVAVVAVTGGVGYFVFKAYLPKLINKPPPQKPGTPPSSVLQNDFSKLGVDIGGWSGSQIGGSAGGYLGGALSGLLGYAGNQLGGLFT